MTVRFSTTREDFPPNVDELRIEQVSLYFVGTEKNSMNAPETRLRFKPQGGDGFVGGAANPVDGIISTAQRQRRQLDFDDRQISGGRVGVGVTGY